MIDSAFRRIPLSSAAQTWARCFACGAPLHQALAHYQLKGLYCSAGCIVASMSVVVRQVPEEYRNGLRPKLHREA